MTMTISDAINSLRQTVAGLETAIEGLFEVLSPVLRPDIPAGGNSKPASMTGECAVAADITDIEARVNRLFEDLLRLKNRLAIVSNTKGPETHGNRSNDFCGIAGVSNYR